MEATLTSQGQLTFPMALRKEWQLKVGDKVLFELSKDRTTAMIKPRTGDVRMLKGCVFYAGPPISVEEMNDGIAACAAEGC